MQFHQVRKVVPLMAFGAALLVSPSWGSDAFQQGPALSGSAASPRTVSQAVADTPVDPRRILQESLARCEVLDGYELQFHVRERTGFWGGMSDWARIHAYYRSQPHAIKMVWLDSNEYREALYIEGHNSNKMTVLPKQGPLGLPPRPVSIAPQAAVTMGRTLRPITDFGLAEMLRLSLSEMERADRAGGAQITYQGLHAPPDLSERAHQIIIVYPQGFSDAGRQDIYISERTGYPIAAYVWEPDGSLLATYLYGSPHPPAPPMNVFRLSRS